MKNLVTFSGRSRRRGTPSGIWLAFVPDYTKAHRQYDYKITRKRNRYSDFIADLVELYVTHEKNIVILDCTNHRDQIFPEPDEEVSEEFLDEEEEMEIDEQSIQDVDETVPDVPDANQLPLAPIDRLNMLTGFTPADYVPVEEALLNVKRFVGKTTLSYLFVSQNPGEEEMLIKVLPFGDGNDQDASTLEAYREALCHRSANMIGESQHRLGAFPALEREVLARGKFPERFSCLFHGYLANNSGIDLGTHPTEFPDDQMYLITWFDGVAKEALLNNRPPTHPAHIKSMIHQLAEGLASLEFLFDGEIRSLHPTNIVIQTVPRDDTHMEFQGIPKSDIRVSVLDFSCMRHEIHDDDFVVHEGVHCNDLYALFADLFEEDEDDNNGFRYLLEETHKALQGDWTRNKPCTNILWLYWLLTLFPEKKKKELSSLAARIADCRSATELFESLTP
ncbi:serine/threonine-protein kinase haspin-like [Clytia hemisphaerica]|uniref:serine/threonine-protein kinase haspin-like n=1 Tax=Clytia hemisphaerica TaxID=252671 RepID=UPI0034D4DDA5